MIAAGPTDPELVKRVGAWKYHGIRGLAWPLAQRLLPAWERLVTGCPVVPALVPVPLHARRRRERGFNQCEILARLLAARTGAEVIERRLVRTRATAQQARLKSDADRAGNLEGAFAARADAAQAGRPVVLVDDLVTSGATVLAAAKALRLGGCCVWGVLALGVATDRDGLEEDGSDEPG